MRGISTPVLSGLAVLLTGVLAFIVVTHSPPGSSAEPPSLAVVDVQSTYTNLGPSVEKALIDSGTAWVYDLSALTDLPGSVARVLDAYQAPLMIPVGEGP